MRFEDLDDIVIHADEPVFPTGVVCRLLAMPEWALKMLDREGVIQPDRKPGKARLYSRNELRQLRYVWHLMEERGVTVKGVKVILELREDS